jgi:hypothetical protein
MKYALILMIALHTMTFTSYGQKTNVPVNVIKAFEQKVSNAKEVEWEYDSEEKNWEVEYEIGKDEFTSEFDENGIWLETEMEIKFSKLPEPVKATLKSDFVEYKVEEVVMIESPGGKFYEIEVELVKNHKEIEYEIRIAPDGKVIQKEEEKETKD